MDDQTTNGASTQSNGTSLTVLYSNNPVAFVIACIIAVAFIIWKIFIFRRAGRSGSGVAVFFSMLMFPLDALVLLWKQKQCA